MATSSPPEVLARTCNYQQWARALQHVAAPLHSADQGRPAPPTAARTSGQRRRLSHFAWQARHLAASGLTSSLPSGTGLPQSQHCP